MGEKLDSGFELLRFSDERYENMTIEIVYDGEQIAQLSVDADWTDYSIELLYPFSSNDFIPRFPVDSFLEAIQAGVEHLKTFREL